MSGPQASEGAASPAPRSRLLKPLLVGSLILNLFLIGAVGGWAFRHHGGPPPGPPGPRGGEPEVMNWLWRLPETRKAEAKALFDASRETRRERRAQIRLAREAALAALEARPFSPGALDAALNLLGEQGDLLTEAAHRDLLTVIGQMTDAERATMAKQLRAPPPRHGGKDDPRPPPPPQD